MFVLSVFYFDFYVVSEILHLCAMSYELGIYHGNRTAKCLINQSRTKAECWSTTIRIKAPILPIISWQAVPRRHFFFGYSLLFYVLFVAMSVIDILFVMLRLAL